MPAVNILVGLRDRASDGLASLRASLLDVEDAADDLDDAVGDEGLGGSLGGLGGLLTGAVAGAVIGFGARLVENTEQIRAIAFETGLTTEQVQLYDQALRAQGFTADEAREQIKSLEQAELDHALALAESSGQINEATILTRENIEAIAEAQQTVDDFTMSLTALATGALADVITGLQDLTDTTERAELAFGVADRTTAQYIATFGGGLQVFNAVADALQANIDVINAYDRALHSSTATVVAYAEANLYAAGAEAYFQQAGTGGIGPTGTFEGDPFGLLGQTSAFRQNVRLAIERESRPARSFGGGGGSRGASRTTAAPRYTGPRNLLDLYTQREGTLDRFGNTVLGQGDADAFRAIGVLDDLRRTVIDGTETEEELNELFLDSLDALGEGVMELFRQEQAANRERIAAEEAAAQAAAEERRSEADRLADGIIRGLRAAFGPLIQGPQLDDYVRSQIPAGLTQQELADRYELAVETVRDTSSPFTGSDIG